MNTPSMPRVNPPIAEAQPTGRGGEKNLVDGFGRQISYLRVSVTDRCDLRCDYCIPKGFKDFQEPEEWLTMDEVTRVVGAFCSLGVSHVRITGGEPLVRRGLPGLLADLSRLPGLDDLSLSTNAVRLQRVATQLRDAGLQRINVSLDSLRADRFAQITGGGKLAKVLAGLEAAHQAGLSPIKINTVVMRGVNDDEIEALIDYCRARGFTLRLIETMPMGDTGRAAQNRYLDLQTVLDRLRPRYNLVPDAFPGAGPARYYRLDNSSFRLGLITPISQHFCETCNRVRLAVDGTLYLCLGQEHSVNLRQPLRAGMSDAQLRQMLLQAMDLKPERHEFRERPDQVVRFMSRTGG